MGKATDKRSARKRVAEISAAARDDEQRLKRAAARRLAKLEKDLGTVHRMQERHRSRLEAATAEADQIRGEIAELLRRASEPAASGARRVGHAADELLDEAAAVVTDAAAAVKDAAGSVVGAARRAARPKRAVTKAPEPPSAAEAADASPVEPAAPSVEPAAPAPSTPRRPRRARSTTPPATGPTNG